MRRLSIAIVTLVTIVLALTAVVEAQDRARTKEVVVGFGAEPRTLLGVTIVDWTTNSQLEHIYDRLLDRDAKTLQPKPMLATAWKVVNDTTWEFALRRNVKFHNGEPFTAQSVKATMDYLKDPANKTHYAAYWKQIKDVQIVDDYTVRFITDGPWPSLIDRVSLTDFLVMPAKALKEQGVQALAQKPIGTGPFKFVEWKRDERLVLERNPDYWAGPADVSRVTFRFIPEFSSRMAALLSGEIDIMKDVPPHAMEVVDRSGRAKVRSTVSSRINYLALVNLKPGPMQDVRVRRAMNHAVDVDELIAKVLKGNASRMCGPLAPANVDFAKAECYKYDPPRAQALFKEAGVDPKTLSLTLDTPSGRYPLDKDVSLAIAAQLQRLGITTNVVVNEWGTHLDKIKNRKTGISSFLGWGPALYGQGTMEPLFKADQTYASYGNNKTIDDKIAKAITVVDARGRAAAYADLQQVLREEAPWVFLWQQHDLYGVASHVEWAPRADEKVWMYDAKVIAPMITVFTNAVLLDCTGAEPVQGASVVVEGDRIKDVLARPGAGAIPGQVTTIDCKGKTLMPGLTDAHVHICAVEGNITDQHRFLPPSLLAAKALRRAEECLMQGFTTVRDAGGADYGFREAINEGRYPGPRMLVSGNYISQTGGHGDKRRRAEWMEPIECCIGMIGSIADGEAEVRKAVREQLRRDVDQIKIMASGGAMSPSDELDTTQYTIGEMRAAVEEAQAVGKYVLSHAYSDTAVRNAITAGVRSIEHGNLIREGAAQAIKDAGAFLVPTMITYEMIYREGKRYGIGDHQIAKINMAREQSVQGLTYAYKAGCKIGSGSDLLGDMMVQRAAEFELKAQVMKPMEVLLSATKVNAELFRMSDKIGTVEAGKYADLLVVEGDPLKNLRLFQMQDRIAVIMKGGVLYKRVV